MPTRNNNLTPQPGLRPLEHTERDDQAKLEALRGALGAGEASGIAEGDVVGEVRERIRRRGKTAS